MKLGKFVFWSFVAIVLGAPLIFIPQIALVYELPKAIFFRIGALIVWFFLVIKILPERKIVFPKIEKHFWMALGAYLFVIVLATILSISPHVSFWGSYEKQQGLFQIIHYVFFFIAALIFFHQNKKYSFKKLIIAICLSALWVSFIAIYQITTEYRVFSTLAHPNLLATYLLMVLPFLVAIAQGSKNKKAKYFWYFAITISLFAMILAGSRGAIIGLIVGAVFYSIVIKKAKLLVAPSLIFIVLIGLNTFGHDFSLQNKVLSRFIIHEKAFESLEIRLDVWPAVIEQIKAKPLLGYGPEMLGEGFLKHYPEEMFKYGMKNVERAHNEIIDITAQTGLLGLLTYLTLLFYIFKIAWPQRKVPLVLAGMTSLLMLFTTNMFNFSTTVHYIFWWLIVAFLITHSKGTGEYKINLKIKNVTRIILIIITTASFIIINTSYNIPPLLADYEYNKGLESLAYFDQESATDHFENATLINPNEIYYGIFATKHALLFLEVERGEYFLEKVKKKNTKKLVDVLFLEGRINYLKKNYLEANEYLEKAHNLSPKNIEILFDWAGALFGIEDELKAMKVFAEYQRLNSLQSH